jgi:kynurenine formamidase
MRVFDLTGPIYQGMWTYGPPYPEVVVEEIPQPDFIAHATYSWRFELGAQTGTYLETSLHVDRSGPPLAEVPIERLFMFPVTIVRVPAAPLAPITRDQLISKAPPLTPGEAIIIATGWGQRWHEADFVTHCPYFEAEAMHWILDHQPWLMAGDQPRFDSWTSPQGFWDRFFQQGTLLLAPLYGLEQITATRGQLVALPLPIAETCASPCRVLFVENKPAE